MELKQCFTYRGIEAFKEVLKYRELQAWSQNIFIRRYMKYINYNYMFYNTASIIALRYNNFTKLKFFYQSKCKGEVL